MKTIFHIDCLALCPSERSDRIYRFDDEFSVELETHYVGTASSVVNAEKLIKSYISYRNVYGYPHIVLGFSVVERRVNMKPTDDWGVCHYRSLRNYDPNGNLIYESPYDDVCEIPFRGSSCSPKFKTGDIVFEAGPNWNNAHAVIVVAEPPSKEWWTAHMKKGVAGDGVDDSYTTIRYKHDHDHPNGAMLFPFVGNVSKKLRNALHSECRRHAKFAFTSKEYAREFLDRIGL